MLKLYFGLILRKMIEYLFEEYCKNRRNYGRKKVHKNNKENFFSRFQLF